MEKKAPALRSVKQKKRPVRSAKRGPTNQREPIADALSALENTIATERDADRKQQERGERGKAFREWATILLLSITAGFVLGQWSEMRRVYAPIADQAQAARESYAAVQRPFVNASLKLIPDPARPGYWFAYLILENTGQTPTRGLEYVTAFVKGWQDPERWFDHEHDVLNVVKGKLAIGPHSTVKVTLPAAVWGMRAGDVPAGKDSRYVGTIIGAIRYSDYFSGSRKHITKFDFQLSDTKFGILALPLPKFNCSDDDCDEDKKQSEK
jgi:hypothetical protein